MVVEVENLPEIRVECVSEGYPTSPLNRTPTKSGGKPSLMLSIWNKQSQESVASTPAEQDKGTPRTHALATCSRSSKGDNVGVETEAAAHRREV